MERPSVSAAALTTGGLAAATRPALPAFLVLLLPPTAATGEWGRLLTAVVCGVVLMACYLVVAFVPGGGFGGGDIQLAPTIGLLLGWFSVGHVVIGTMAAFVIGGVAILLAIFSPANCIRN